MQTPIRIAITPGEPAGIGPELILQLALQSLPFEILAIANLQLLQKLAQKLNLDVQLKIFDPGSTASSHPPGRLEVMDISIPSSVVAGKLNVENSTYVIETLNTAIDLVNNKICQALTTGPVQKSIINEAGIPFSGHTEYLAKKNRRISGNAVKQRKLKK